MRISLTRSIDDVTHLQVALVVIDDGLTVEVGDALDLEQRVVDGVRDVVAHPLGEHDGDHDGQQERHVVRYLDLQNDRTARNTLRYKRFKGLLRNGSVIDDSALDCVLP